MPSVRELQTGLWHWQAPHPGWESNEPWDQEVSSYAIDDGTRLLLFDPLGVPGRDRRARRRSERRPIVLTCPWHERDTESLVERLGVPVFAPPPETQEDLDGRSSVSPPSRLPAAAPTWRWLRTSDTLEKTWSSAGDQLTVGVEAFLGKDPRKTSCIGSRASRAVVAGDRLVDFGQGLEINQGWLREKDTTREEVAGEMRPLLELPVELVLPTNGPPPTDRAALERALS